MGEFFKKKEVKVVRRPNLNAPRESVKRHNVLSKNLFNRYKEKYPNSSITWIQFKKIIDVGNNIYVNKVCENREGVEFPFGLGRLFIGSFPKRKDKNFDYKLSIIYGMDIEHKNFESNQYLCKIVYTAADTKYEYRLRKYWYFRPARNFKRLVSKKFRENWNHYIKIPHFQKISKMAKLEGIKSIKIARNEYKGRRIDFSDTQPH